MLDNELRVRIEVRSENLRRELGEILRSVGGFEIQQKKNGFESDLLIFQLGSEAENDFAQIKSLVTATGISEVFLTSENTDPALLLQALRIGAKEFFSQPLKREEVRRALNDFKDRRENSCPQLVRKSGQIFTIMGSKGGVGTTTFAVNLAAKLQELNSCQSVVLVDLNMLFGDIPLFLSLNPTYHWGDITKEFERCDSTFLKKVLSKHSSGIEVLCAPGVLNGSPPLSPEITAHLLEMLKTMFDFVVVDAGKSLSESVLSVLGSSKEIFLITTLTLPCLSNAKRILSSLLHLGFDTNERMKIVINRFQKNSSISIGDAEETIGKTVYWTVPNDYSTTISAINHGKSISEVSRKAGISNSFQELGTRLLYGERKEEKKTWMLLKRALQKMKPLRGADASARDNADREAHLMTQTIHELRKLAGHKQIMKGMTKEKYVQIILERENLSSPGEQTKP